MGQAVQERAQTLVNYEPSSRIKQLSTVDQRPQQPILCTCRRCSRVITSTWYFVNPGSKSTSVLIPQPRGCANPSSKQKNKCVFVAPRACPFKCITDSFGGLT